MEGEKLEEAGSKWNTYCVLCLHDLIIRRLSGTSWPKLRKNTTGCVCGPRPTTSSEERASRDLKSSWILKGRARNNPACAPVDAWLKQCSWCILNTFYTTCVCHPTVQFGSIPLKYNRNHTRNICFPHFLLIKWIQGRRSASQGPLKTSFTHHRERELGGTHSTAFFSWSRLLKVFGGSLRSLIAAGHKDIWKQAPLIWVKFKDLTMLQSSSMLAHKKRGPRYSFSFIVYLCVPLNVRLEMKSKTKSLYLLLFWPSGILLSFF